MVYSELFQELRTPRSLSSIKTLFLISCSVYVKYDKISKDNFVPLCLCVRRGKKCHSVLAWRWGAERLKKLTAFHKIKAWA